MVKKHSGIMRAYLNVCHCRKSEGKTVSSMWTNYMTSPRKTIYSYIAERGVASKVDILEQFPMASSTLTRLLEELVSDGAILASRLGTSSGGRRPILYETNPGFGYFFGLEISRFHSSLGFFDVRMNPMSFTRWRMDESMTPERLVEHVSNNMRAILQDHRIEPRQVVGVGIGAVGPLDRERGTLLQPLYFPAKGWASVQICKLVEEATGFRARLENGANAALMGEHWAMRQGGSQHMLYVHAGVGLRSAMMSYGRIIHGSVDMEGAVGQMIIQTDGPRLQDAGNYGALEAFVSVQALERRAQSQAKMGGDAWKKLFPFPPERIRYEDLLQPLREEHPLIAELFGQSATYFGVGLANMINMLHPETIILGGTLINSHEKFYRTAIEIARTHIYYSSDYEPVFSKGELREDAVATGAALMIWREMNV